MDCDSLRADIEKLCEMRDAFEASANYLFETNLGNNECAEALERVSAVEDEILKTYSKDFIKSNYEFFSDLPEQRYEYAGEVRGLEGVEGPILPLTEDMILGCSSPRRGGIAIYQRQPDGGYEVARSFDDWPMIDVGRAELTADGDVILMKYMGHGLIGFLTKTDDGHYEFSRFDYDEEGWNHISQVVTLSSGEVLILGKKNAYDPDVGIGVYRRNEDGSGYSEYGYVESEHMGEYLDSGNDAFEIIDADSMIVLPSGDIALSDEDGNWGILEHYPPYFYYEDCESDDDLDGSIEYSFNLPTGQVIIGTSDNSYFVCSKQKTVVMFWMIQ